MSTYWLKDCKRERQCKGTCLASRCPLCRLFLVFVHAKVGGEETMAKVREAIALAHRRLCEAVEVE